MAMEQLLVEAMECLVEMLWNKGASHLLALSGVFDLAVDLTREDLLCLAAQAEDLSDTAELAPGSSGPFGPANKDVFVVWEDYPAAGGGRQAR